MTNFKWTSSKVDCYNPHVQEDSVDFYHSFSLNGIEFNIGEFALIQVSSNNRIGRLLCVYHSYEDTVKYKGMVQWYSWARQVIPKLNEKLKYDEDNEVIEEMASTNSTINLKDIKMKCQLIFADLQDSVNIVEHNNLNPVVYFSCRYKLDNNKIVPYFTDDIIESCYENYTVMSELEAEGTPKTKSKRKLNNPVAIINLDSEGSDLDEFDRIRSTSNVLKNIKLTPKSDQKLSGALLNSVNRHASVKRVLNDSFGSSPTSPSGIPIFSCSILSPKDECTNIKMKFKMTDNKNGSLKVIPTKLDSDILKMKSPIKLKDLLQTTSRLIELSPERKLRSRTPAKIGQERRRSSRAIERISYAEFCSPEKSTAKKRRESVHQTPLKELIENKILDKIVEDNENVRPKRNVSSPNKYSDTHISTQKPRPNSGRPKKHINMDVSSEESINQMINKNCNSFPVVIIKEKESSITKGHLKDTKNEFRSDDSSDEETGNTRDIEKSPKLKRRIGRQSKYGHDATNSPLSNVANTKNKLKSPPHSRNTKNKFESDESSEEEEEETESTRNIDKTVKRSVGRPKKYNNCNTISLIDGSDKSSDDEAENTGNLKKSPRPKRSIRRPIKYDNMTNSSLRNDTANKSKLKTPSKSKPNLRKTVHRSTKAILKCSESDEEVELKTPKRKVAPATIKSGKKDTPSARAKKIREGIITPSVQAREKAVVKDSTPLFKARTQLHVSFLPKSLPCREKEFSDIVNFLKGKLLDGCGGCMYISGVPGTGKTATVTEVIRNLDELVTNEDVPSFKYVNINGMRLSEPRQAYVEIMKQLTGKTVHWEEAQTMLENKFARLQKKSTPIILVVDELDILCTKRQDVVYNLLDWPTKANARLIVVTIANTMDLPERLLMGRVTSRLGLTRLTFKAYTHKQLQEIVTKRLTGISAFNPDAIQLVARKVASVSGDARRALDICRRAVEIAQLEGKNDLVSMVHVNQALSAMITQPKVQAIKRCSRLQKLLLQAVVAEVERTGVEETNFTSVFKMLIPIAALDGFQMVSSTVAFGGINQLGACRLLLTDQKCSNIYQKIILNVSVDDVYYALTKTDL